MAAVAVQDQLDGTVDATISGTSGGAWQLYAGRWFGTTYGVEAWTLAASGTGDGVAAAVVPPDGTGPNFWTVVVAGVYSPPILVAVRPQGQCPWERAVRSIQQTINALSLSGLDAGAVKVRQLPRRVDGDPLPLIIVSPWPAESVQGRMNAKDTVGYPCTVAFFDGANGLLDKNIGQWLNWRHQVAAMIRESRIETGENGIFRVIWKPDLPASVQALAQDYLIGAMLFEAISRETRGPR